MNRGPLLGVSGGDGKFGGNSTAKVFIHEKEERGGGEKASVVEVYGEEGGGVGGGERETVGLVAGPPPLLVFLKISFSIYLG